jgi:hypothetical protein
MACFLPWSFWSYPRRISSTSSLTRILKLFKELRGIAWCWSISTHAWRASTNSWGLTCNDEYRIYWRKYVKNSYNSVKNPLLQHTYIDKLRQCCRTAWIQSELHTLTIVAFLTMSSKSSGIPFLAASRCLRRWTTFDPSWIWIGLSCRRGIYDSSSKIFPDTEKYKT